MLTGPRTIARVRAGVSLLVAGVFLTGASSAPAAAPKPGDVIVGDSNNAKVYWLDPDTGKKRVLSDDGRLVSPNDSAFSPDGKTLYVADYGAFGDTGGVFEINPKTGHTSVLAKEHGFDQPDGLAVAPNGDVFVTDLAATADAGALFRVSVPNGNVHLVGSGDGLENATGVVVPANGRPLVSSGNFPSVVRVNPQTGDQTVTADAGDGLTGTGGLARASDGTLYVADAGLSTLQSIDPHTADVDTVATGFETDGYGLASDAHDRVLGCAGEAVNRANPQTGGAEELGHGFGYPEGLEVVPH